MFESVYAVPAEEDAKIPQKAAPVCGCVLRYPLCESYSKTAHQSRRAYPSRWSAPLFSYPATASLKNIGLIPFLPALRRMFTVRNISHGSAGVNTFRYVFSCQPAPENTALQDRDDNEENIGSLFCLLWKGLDKIEQISSENHDEKHDIEHPMQFRIHGSLSFKCAESIIHRMKHDAWDQ